MTRARSSKSVQAGEKANSTRASSAIPASNLVRGEWLRRVEAEYRSAAITQHLTLWLMQIGASPDLVRLGLRIASDELAHAELSHATYARAGGRELPRIARETLGLVRHDAEPLEHDVARVGLEVFCLGETVAVPLFKELRERCVVPVARRALDRVLRDEVRHRDFGWTLVPALLELPDPAMAASIRALVERVLPSAFARLRAVYAPEAARSKTRVTDDERAWGLLPPARYGEILHRTVERDWVPRFARIGIDAQRAWEAGSSDS